MPKNRFAGFPCALIALLLAAILSACSGPEPEAATKTITGTDGALQFEVPASWSAAADLNAVATLQAGDQSRDAYAIVVADPLAPFESVGLAKFADTEIQKQASVVGLANVSPPTEVEVGGHPGLQFRLSGLYDSEEVVYLFTFIRTDDRILKVVAWSLAENFEQNRRVLLDITHSVRQIKPLPTTGPGSAGRPTPSRTGPVQDPPVIR